MSPTTPNAAPHAVTPSQAQRFQAQAPSAETGFKRSRPRGVGR